MIKKEHKRCKAYQRFYNLGRPMKHPQNHTAEIRQNHRISETIVKQFR